MPQSALKARRSTHALGAEVTGVDLSRPLDPAVVKEVVDHFHEHQVLFFRDQHIDDVAQRDFAAHFGPLQRFAFLRPVSEDVPEVHAIDIDPSRPKTANSDIWHSDATFLRRPPLGSLLRAVTLPDVGGDTLWASMYAAYDALSSRVQRLLDGMTAVHDSSNSASHARNAVNADFEPSVHPVVRTHPVTGRKALFVNEGFTTRINELNEYESEALLKLLFAHATRPEFSIRWRWQENDVAFWDNRVTQHFAVDDYRPSRRVMHRATILGDAPF